MHAAVCDDNITELSHISTILEEYRATRESSFSYEIFQNASELLDNLASGRFDLLLLDIIMPALSGIEAAGEVRANGLNLPIIFLTSSREYAVESYRVNAADYIMKPIAKNALFAALDKQVREFKCEADYLAVKSVTNINKLYLSEIIYVEVRNHRLLFTLSDESVLEVTGSLGDYEKDLLADGAFFKPHRSYIVNLSYIESLDKAGFHTINAKTVPISRDSFARAKAAYLKYLLKKKAGED